MPTTSVAIQLTLDEKGVVSGLRSIGGELDNLGKRAGGSGKQASEGIHLVTREQERAREATNLLSRGLGIEVPRSIEKLIGQSKMIGPAMAAAFQVGVVVAVGAAIVSLAGDIKQGALALGGFTAEMQAFKTASIEANNAQQVGFKSVKAGQSAIGDTSKRLGDQQKEIEYLRETTKLRNFDVAGIVENIVAHVQYGKAVKENIVTGEIHNKQLEHESELTTALSVKLAQLQGQVAGAHARGPFQQIAADEQTAVKVLDATYAGELRSSDEYKSALAAVHALAAEKLLRTWEDFQVKLHAIMKGVSKDVVDAGSAEQSKKAEAGGKIKLDAEQKANDKTLALLGAQQDAEYETAVARAQISGQSLQMIALQEQKRVNDTIGGLRLIGASEAELAKIRPQLQAASNARMYQEYRSTIERMGSDFESLWDDITGGNIGKRILSNWKKMMFQMVAQWALGSQAMRGIAGSTLGSLLLGPGNSTLQMLGGGAGIAGMGGSTAGGGFNLGTLLGGGSTAGGFGGSLIPGVFGMPTGTAATFGGSTSALGGGYGATILGQHGFSPIALSPIAAKTGFGGGLLSANGLGAMLPFLGASLGGKLGGTTGAIGAGILGSVGWLAMHGGNAVANSLGVLTGLGPSAGALLGGAISGVGGGLLGFGVGQQYGKVAGSLSGAGSGALMGFLAGGPIGAAIGGIIGLLGGLFGGLFGGSKRQRQADDFASKQVAEIHKLVSAYKSFQIDYGSALGQLDTMQSQSTDQLGQLKGEGRKTLQRTLLPEFARARSDIEGNEKERTRRLGLFVAPPMFAGGGTVSYGWTGPRGGVMVEAHPGEEIVNPRSSAKYRSTIKAINEDRMPAGGDTIVINAVDAKSFRAMLQEHGWQTIKELGRQNRREARA